MISPCWPVSQLKLETCQVFYCIAKHKSGSQRCILFDSHSLQARVFPQHSFSRQNLPIRLPALLPIVCSITKTLKRELGVCMIVYIHDILIPGRVQQIVKRPRNSWLVYLLECLGFIINKKKSILTPSRSLEFLGFVVNTLTMELKLSGDKLYKICIEASKLLNKERSLEGHSPVC